MAVLNALGGNDIVRAGGGNDEISGGKGDDRLYGEGGDDTYIWNVGDGNDVIEDGLGENVLRVDGLSSMDGVVLLESGADLVLRVGAERITVKNWLEDPAHRLKEIRFGDLEVWSRERINTMLGEVLGTDDNDVLEGRNHNLGDTLVGLKGDDVLMGGAGDDTYVWNPGDGNDRIVDQQGDNVLRFGEGIAPDDVRVERDENHLYLTVQIGRASCRERV